MGSIAHFIRRAEASGLRNEIPNDSVFLTHGDGVCLILSERLPCDGLELGSVLLVFGEPSSPADHPPRLAFRHHVIGNCWDVCIETEDDIPSDLLEFAKQYFGLEDTDTAFSVSSDTLDTTFDIFLGRVMRPSLACAS